VDLLAPVHRHLPATELYLASHHLRLQKKHHLQSRLDLGYQGIVKQNVKVSLPCAVVLTLSRAPTTQSGTLIR
jgi:hypothetical protein